LDKNDPEKAARKVLDACADCDVCRFLMDISCLYFPELYRLYDREVADKIPITAEELRGLVDRCNFCGQCPCPNIRAGIIEAKTRFIERDGLKFGVRTLEDVERIGRLASAFPLLTNTLFRMKPLGRILKTAAGIHRSREIPHFPSETFPAWAQKNNLTIPRAKDTSRKIAYFAGCTGKLLFPEVPKAVATIFRHNGFDVYYPEQKCCGMPPLLEGDRDLTLDYVRFNVERLSAVVEEGYDIVCSCPTCGYFLKSVLVAGAYFSEAYQKMAGGDEKEIKVPGKRGLGAPTERKFTSLTKSIYRGLLKDDGYFSEVNPLKRIRVAEHTYDLGEYLAHLHRQGALVTDFRPVPGRLVYYPPCHLREQEIGTPYVELLQLIPGIDLEPVPGGFYCCGLGGLIGFKKEFHQSSIELGSNLMEKTRAMHPDRIVTDCLSCRLQFNQLLSNEVVHPVEIFREAYSIDF
jgi:glycerol-3-phosphate dehydrogenase subunit C